MRTKVLVTGANGQLGKSIKEVSGNYQKFIEFLFLDKSKLDITNDQEIEAFFIANKLDYCINCAAYTNVDLAENERDKALAVNAYATKNLALACKKWNVSLIHISTDYVFDGNKSSPYIETDKTNPINVYGESKLLGEKYIQENTTNYFIIRVSWLYSKFDKNFVKTIFEKLENNKKLTITTSQRGTPTSCEDLSKFIIFLVLNKTDKFGIYHLTAQGETTWYDLALEIAKKLKKHDYVSPILKYKTLAKRPEYSVLNNKKAMSLSQEFVQQWQKSVDKVIEELILKN
jgi:dTDP-4-dehydrorhamnose reductase